MSDLIDLSQIDSIALTSNILAVGAIVICVLAIFIAFIYGKMNASLEHKLKLKGTYEGKLKELQNIEIELKEKQSLKEDVEKKTARLKSEYEQFAANKEAIDQVKGQLNALGSEYQGKLQQLQDLDRELSKSEALKDFINNHQQEQLDALDQKIRDKEERLKELSDQVNEKLSSGVVKDSLSQMFSELADNSDLKSEGQNCNERLKICASGTMITTLNCASRKTSSTQVRSTTPSIRLSPLLTSKQPVLSKSKSLTLNSNNCPSKYRKKKRS